MADTMLDDLDDYDYYEEEGDNYDYVEDGYDIADELVSQAIPDAPEFDGADFWDDHTRYEYWNDIEYDTDGYNDVQPKEKRKNKAVKTSDPITPKRLKRHAVDSPVSARKKRKIDEASSAPKTLPPILLVRKEAMEAGEAPTIDVTRLSSYAILPDWRDRFSDNNEFSEFLSSGSLAVKLPHATYLVEEEEEEGDEEGPDDEAGVGISQEALKMALQQHLGSLGVADLGNIDENMLLKLMEQMLSGEDVQDEMLDQIVDGVHDEEEEGQDTKKLSGWISSQVKSTEVDDEEEPLVSEEPARPNKRRRATEEAATADVSKPGFTPTRGTKRNAESPRSSPRKKSKNQPDSVTAKG